MAKKFQRKQSAASAMFHVVSDRMRSSTGHSTLMAAADEAERGSSIAVLHYDKDDGFTTADETTIQSGEKLSWWDRPDTTTQISCWQRTRVGVDIIVLLGVGVGLFFAAHLTQNRALPFIYAFIAALATYESTWLAYRLRLRLFLPFQLHQKQTCRDIYTQIMKYSVDLQTCAITPFAERVFRGRKLLAAALTAAVCCGAALLISWFCESSKTLVGYISMTTFLCVWCCSLAPNMRDATVLLVRYVYFTLSTASLLILSPPSASVSNPNPILDPFHMMLLCMLLIMIVRTLSSKDPMETIVMALLDIASLVYLACLSNVLNYLTAFTSDKASDVGEGSGMLASRHTIVFAVFFIICCSEVGSFLMEKLLREAQFPWTHPLSSRLSSRQNFEKLAGALILGVGASFLVTNAILPDNVLRVNPIVFLVTCVAAIVISFVCKLWLISLKKVAKVSATGRYLSVGDGVIDRIDSFLIATIVFTVVLRRVLA